MHFWEVAGRKPCAIHVQEKRLCKLCANKTCPGICANLVQGFWPAVARGWPLARPNIAGRTKAASGSKIAPAVVLRLFTAGTVATPPRLTASETTRRPPSHKHGGHGEKFNAHPRPYIKCVTSRILPSLFARIARHAKKIPASLLAKRGGRFQKNSSRKNAFGCS